MNDSFDLLIIGGGINGTGIARDAAGRGHKVMLVEQDDLASATSSASTKLIHGGLRYLELFEFRLVREALIERERLMGIAPHIIQPMQFVVPHRPGLRPRWQIRAGLFLYDHLASRQRLPDSRSVSLLRGPWSGTLQPQLTHGFTYADCWVDDSRLVVLNAMDAAQRGASIRTRTRFIGASASDGHWRVRVEDLASGEQSTMTARAMVNAAGPWVENVLHHVPRTGAEAQIRLVKGSHIVVPRLYEGDHAFLLQHPDGRVVFAIPYQDDFTLVGTTDVPYNGDPAGVAITQDEIEYLCATMNEYFTRRISSADVRWTFAGVRPLSDDEASHASKVTRDYRLEVTSSQGQPALLSVFGGKITTYRRLAETAMQKLHPFLGGSKQGWTDQVPLPGGDLPRGDFAAFLAGVRQRWPFLPDTVSARLARCYGTRISDIVTGAKAFEDLGTDFGAGLTRAEADYLRTHEWARTSEDILWRRTKAGLTMNEEQRANFARWMVAGR